MRMPKRIRDCRRVEHAPGVRTTSPRRKEEATERTVALQSEVTCEEGQTKVATDASREKTEVTSFDAVFHQPATVTTSLPADVPSTEVGLSALTVQLSYDGLGRVKSRKELETGREESYLYDSLGRLLRRLRTDSTQEDWWYQYQVGPKTLDVISTCLDAARADANRTQTTEHYEDGHLANHTWRHGDSPTSLAVAATESFDYAGARAEQRTDAEGKVHVFAYDDAGLGLVQSVSTTVPATGTTLVEVQRTFESQGRLVAEAGALGELTLIHRDGLGRVAEIVYRDAGVVGAEATRFLKDAAGNVVTELSGNLQTTTAPDVLGQPFTVKGEGVDTKHVNDIANRHTLNVDNETGLEEETWRNDVLGRVTKRVVRVKTLVGGQPATVTQEETHTYTANVTARTWADAVLVTVKDPQDSIQRIERRTVTRDTRGLLLEEVFPVTGLTGDVRVHHAYDAQGHRTKTETFKPGAGTDATFTHSWAYDASGNLMKDTDERGNATTYEYDGTGRRLAQVGPHKEARLEWSYDAAGRLAKRRVRTQTGPSTYAFKEWTYTYPGNGEVVELSPEGAIRHTFVNGQQQRVPGNHRGRRAGEDLGMEWCPPGNLGGEGRCLAAGGHLHLRRPRPNESRPRRMGPGRVVLCGADDDGIPTRRAHLEPNHFVGGRLLLGRRDGAVHPGLTGERGAADDGRGAVHRRVGLRRDGQARRGDASGLHTVHEVHLRRRRAPALPGLRG